MIAFFTSDHLDLILAFIDQCRLFQQKEDAERLVVSVSTQWRKMQQFE